MASPVRAVVASEEPLGEDAVEGLVGRAQQGDSDAFAALYRARVSAVARYVGAMLRDPDRTEDAVAETFCLAWRDLPKLRNPGRFGRVALPHRPQSRSQPPPPAAARAPR